ncbi:mitochondrial inner-membrane-bound regulator-domain-containing protein [Aspergillus stella-maris]|uniref:mitochondrial inner-membrane-bound regulator-domain-containing protein n=1 Tax=Aspergillus stella-maris TaxID=1810926 RepID=UPI003CCE0B2A
MQAFVPKNRRPRFELVLRIIDLNNIPLVSGTAYIKWRLPSANANEHHGSTDKALILDHKASWNYERTLQVRMTIDRDQTLQGCEIQFDVIQEFSSGGHHEKNLLGRVKLNLSEYVDKSDDDEGIVRRYLMQDSKINSTLKIGIVMQQVEGDRNFTTPPLKSAMAFGGIAGVVASEQAEADDSGQIPLINTQSREVADMQEMYRRTLAASWTSRADDMPADKLIEGLFSENVGRSDSRDADGHSSGGHHDERPNSGAGATGQNGSRNLLSPSYDRRAKGSSRNFNASKGLDFSPAIDRPEKNGSIEHQLYDNAKGKSWRNRNNDHELSEFDVREDLRSWEVADEFDDDFDDEDGRKWLPEKRLDNKEDPKPRKDRAEKVTLNVSTLGEPGEIVVVQEKRRRMRRRHSRKTSNPREDPYRLPSLLGEHELDTTPLDGERLNDLIDSCRGPHQPRTLLAAEEFQTLRANLRASFTISHLSDYVKEYSNRVVDASEEAFTTHGVLTSAQWKPGTSAFTKTGLASKETLADRTINREDFTIKIHVVERILRDCWQLGIINETGEIDLYLPTHTLSLLVNSEIFSFEELASRNEVSISVINSLGHVRITGKQRPCESVREIIHDYTNRIRAEELGFVVPAGTKARELAQAFSPEFLSWVQQTYNVSVEHDSSRLPTQLYVLAENQHNAEPARRTLNLALKKATSPGVPFSTYIPASELSDIQDAKPGKTANWHDRTNSWFRWQMPPVSNRLVSLPGFVENENQPTISAELLKVLRQTPARTNSSTDLKVRESITATFGKCLFMRSPVLQETQVNAAQLGSMALPRAFVTDIPQFTKLLRSLTLHAIEDGSRSHSIRLVPSAAHVDKFPPLELDIVALTDLYGKDSVGIRSVKAVLAESSVDHLLPESVVDVRFTRKLTHELLNGTESSLLLETLLEDIQGCFRKSMASNVEVPLPTFTSLTLPNHVLQSKGQCSDEQSESTAEYLYLPVSDVQGTHVSRYGIRNTELHYASYDSGPYGAPTTTDLYLRMESADETDPDNVVSNAAPTPQPNAKQFNGLYGTACAVASHLDLLQ